MKTMKKYILGIVFISFAVACACVDECEKDEDCPTDQCCVTIGAYPIFGGRVCGKFLTEGSYCIKDQEYVKNFTGYNYYFCPCASGLSCAARKYVTISWFGKIEYDFHCSAAVMKDDGNKDDEKKDDDKKDDEKKDDDKKDDEKKDSEKKDDEKKDDDKKDDEKKDDEKKDDDKKDSSTT